MALVASDLPRTSIAHIFSNIDMPSISQSAMTRSHSAGPPRAVQVQASLRGQVHSALPGQWPPQHRSRSAPPTPRAPPAAPGLAAEIELFAFRVGQASAAKARLRLALIGAEAVHDQASDRNYIQQIMRNPDYNDLQRYTLLERWHNYVAQDDAELDRYPCWLHAKRRLNVAKRCLTEALNKR